MLSVIFVKFKMFIFLRMNLWVGDEGTKKKEKIQFSNQKHKRQLQAHIKIGRIDKIKD